MIGRSDFWPMLLACALAGAVLSPVLGAGFYGDDFHLWHVGRKLIADPGIFFIGPTNFYRPANAWLFAAHHLVYGTWIVGYHLTTLMMHLGCGVLLGRLLNRFGIGPWAAAAGAAFWMLSPYAFEPVMYVNVSYNDLTVLLVWLGLACLWPGPEQRWTRGRLAAAAALIVFSAFCKESWVIIAPLAVVFDLTLARSTWCRAARTGVVLALPVAAYVVVYAMVFAGRESYYDVGGHVLSKIPHLWACFTLIEQLEPYQPGFGGGEAVGLALMFAIAALGLRRWNRAIVLGGSWFLISLLPILPVSWIPTRYTAVPLAGFVIAMVGVFQALYRLSPETRRRTARLGIAAVVVSALAINLVWMRGELKDMRRLTRYYERLIFEAQTLAPHLEDDLPLVCVRGENDNLQHRIHIAGYFGIEKFQYVRRTTPYGLASWPALFTYVRTGLGDELYLDPPPELMATTRYAVVVHLPGRFEFAAPLAQTLEDEVAAWKERGFSVRAVVPTPG